MTVHPSVLIADSLPLFADALSLAFRRSGRFEVFQEYPTSAIEAEKAVLKLRPDVLILDCWIKGMEGSVVVDRLREICPEQKIILLGSFYSPKEIANGVSSGATAVLLKDSPLDHVLSAVEKVSRGERMVLKTATESAIEPGRAFRSTAKDLGKLTHREIEVLRLLASGLSPIRIAERLCIRVSTVRTHINHILRKSKSDSALQAIVSATRSGLLR